MVMSFCSLQLSACTSSTVPDARVTLEDFLLVATLCWMPGPDLRRTSSSGETVEVVLCQGPERDIGTYQFWLSIEIGAHHSFLLTNPPNKATGLSPRGSDDPHL